MGVICRRRIRQHRPHDCGYRGALRCRLDLTAHFLRGQRKVEQVGELGRQIVRCQHQGAISHQRPQVGRVEDQGLASISDDNLVP